MEMNKNRDRAPNFTSPRLKVFPKTGSLVTVPLSILYSNAGGIRNAEVSRKDFCDVEDF